MKSVILFNKREMTYSVIGINYTDDEAKKEVDNLKELGGFLVDQSGKIYDSVNELDARIFEITRGRVSRG